MKSKIVILMVAIAAFCQIASAGIAVQWEGLDGFVQIDGVTGLTDGFTGIAYLVFAANTSTHGVSLQAGTFLHAGESLIGSYVALPGAPGDTYGTVFTQNSPELAFQAGFIYARVFGSDVANSAGLPLADTWYFESAFVATQDKTSADPQYFNINGGSAGIPGFNTDIVNMQVVPEPSVLAFLGLGGLALAARRRFIA